MAASYSATLDFLYALQLHGIKLGLDTTRALLERVGRPQDRYLSLHVGGTNGKGSTAAMAASVLQAAGYRVGLYTSPHLIDFRERIRVNGVHVSEDRVLELTERLREASAESLSPTFFEMTTAMALLQFADCGVDIAVLEVGMGGRFDATNVVLPAAVAITNVALDHQRYLGDSLEAIAFEKAGIIKPGVSVVVGRLDRDADEVITRNAVERGACLRRLGSDFRCEGDRPSRFCYDGMTQSYTDLSCPLEGAHQMDNAACALAMIEEAGTAGIRVSEPAVRQGLRAVSWEGRLEIAEARPILVLDGAHNPSAARAVAVYLAGFRRKYPGSRVVLVTGMMRDKDRGGFFRAILPTVDEVVVTEPSLSRAATVQELRASLAEFARAVYVERAPGDALARARLLAKADDLICVTGSLMLVGEIKALLRGCELSPITG